MADPYLSDDESVILATDKVLFRAVSVPALVLTNKRILFIRTKGEELSADEILLPALHKAEIAEHAAPDPALILTYGAEGGKIHVETVTFLDKGGKKRTEECVEWAGKLTGQILPSAGKGTIVRIPPSAREPPAPPAEEPGVRAGVTAPSAPPVPSAQKATIPPKKSPPVPAASPQSEILAKHDRPAGLAFPSVPKITGSELPESPAPAPRRRFFRIAGFVLVILAVLAAVVIISQYVMVKPAVPPVPVTPAPAATTIPSPVPTPLPSPAPAVIPAANETLSVPLNMTQTPPPAPTPAVTATGTAPAPQYVIPQTGVWVRVRYDGNFTGSVGEGATFRNVAGTGEHFYQLAMTRGTVRAIVDKPDNTGRLLTVDLYRNGVLIQHDETTAPQGQANIQIELFAQTPPQATVIPNTTALNATGTG